MYHHRPILLTLLTENTEDKETSYLCALVLYYVMFIVVVAALAFAEW
jgi:hypothetical protein